FLRWGLLPNNVPSIASTLAAEDVELHAALSRLRRAIESLESAPESYPAHPYLGVMNRNDWVRFHEVHAAHHLREIR
ncbi:MAG TPA: DUF1569 domain-containing protein, partial [Phycisphaerae bacterium]|nr:DUF1569 domain-containing protein [Phycisphaerae bacterium]